MVATNYNFSNMCRICTKYTMSLYSLYEDDNDGISSNEKLKAICGIEVDDSDGFPKTICRICRKKLKNYYDFRIMCLSSQQLLTSYNDQQECIDNFVDARQFDSDEGEEIQYFIEIEDEEESKNEEELLFSDVERFFQKEVINVCKNDKKITKTKIKKPTTKIKKSKMYDPNKKHKCKVCKKRFNSELRVKLHMQRLHKQIYLEECKVSCPKCGMKFQHTRNLKRHLVYHNSDSYFACEFCDKKSFSKKSWRKHIKIHDEKIEVICKICNKTILSRLAQIYHMEYHHTKEVLNKKIYFYCLTCQEEFQLFADLESHCIENHRLKIPEEHDYLTENGSDRTEKQNEANQINACVEFRCNICSRLYKNLADLKFHVEECVAKVNKPKTWMCDVCGKCFANAWTLTNHKAGHSTARPFICDVCGQRFKWHNDLTNHKSRIHDKIRPYVCKICGKRCGTSATLKSHTLSHTGEKPFSCTICDAKFAQSSSLKEHVVKHVGSARLPCPICNKPFPTRLRLRAHLTRHAATRPLYPCPLCPRMFTERASVKKHQRNIHANHIVVNAT